MRVDAAVSFARFVGDAELPATRWLLHTAEAGPLPPQATDEARIVAVGPEGGFAPGEVAAALAAGWHAATLGPRVLRVETAAVVACQ